MIDLPYCDKCKKNHVYVAPNGRIGKLCASCAWQAIERLVLECDEPEPPEQEPPHA